MDSQFKILPQFPLSLVAFPTEELNLHIFEPRYRELIHDCVSHNLTFGIIPVLESRVQGIGTEMKILEISKKYEDGKLDIKTKGLRTFVYKDFQKVYQEKLYGAASVRFLNNDFTTDVILRSSIIDKMKELYTIMKITKSPFPENEHEFTSYSLAHKIGFSIDQEYDLLKMNSEVERLNYVNQHLDAFLPSVIEAERMRKIVSMNGHFKNVIPPNI